jgi:hypothetical protein
MAAFHIVIQKSVFLHCHSEKSVPALSFSNDCSWIVTRRLANGEEMQDSVCQVDEETVFSVSTACVIMSISISRYLRRRPAKT